MRAASILVRDMCAFDTEYRPMLLLCTDYKYGQIVTCSCRCLCSHHENIDLTASLLSSSLLSESSLQSHVHTRASTTAIATTAAHRYALAKLDVHVATMVSVH